MNKILFMTSWYFIQKNKLSLLMPCLSASAEFTLESYRVKTWPVKPIPGEKRLNVSFPQSILLNLFIPVVMLNSWYSWWTSELQDDELNLIHFTPVKSLRQSLVSARARRNHRVPRWFFFLEYQAKFLGYDRLFFSRFNDISWWIESWMLPIKKYLIETVWMEIFPIDNPG